MKQRELYRMMTPAQEELRMERLAVMQVEGVSEERAEEFCNSEPQLYGFVGREEQQDSLFPAVRNYCG